MPIAPDGSPLPYPGDPSAGGFPETIQVGGAPEGPAPAGGAAPDDKIKQIIEMAAQILGDDGLDEAEKVFIAQITAMAQKLLGSRQKERDGLATGKATPSALRTGLGG